MRSEDEEMATRGRLGSKSVRMGLLRAGDSDVLEDDGTIIVDMEGASRP